MTMMISKFHKLIQSKIVWGAFAVLISIAFVGVYTPGAKDRSQAKRDQKENQLAGILFGEEVTRLEFGHAWNATRVMVGLYSMIDQRFGMSEEQIYDAAWVRLATLKKAKQLKLIASDDQLEAMIQRNPLFQNRQTGQYDPNAYSMFVSQILPRLRLSPKGFEQIVRENVLIEKVVAIPAQGGLVSEEEIKKAFHLYTDLLTVEYAAIPRRLADTPEVTEEEAENYFKGNQEQFRMQEKVLVNYVQFAVADYLDQVEATDEMVAQVYENTKQRYLKTPAEDAAADAAPEFKPLEEVKDEIVGEIRMALARKVAADLADELVSDLADESMTFEKVAKALELSIVDNTPSFTLIDPVKGIDPTAPFQRAAFVLENDESHYYSDPVVGRDFVYVLSLVKKYDSFLPSFDIVREAATEAAKLAAAETAYIEKAGQVHGEIQTALKAGTPFAKAIAKQKLDLKTTESFNITSRLEDEFGQEIKAATARFDKGKLTGLIPTPDEFLVAYIAEKVPGDEAVALPGLRAELASSIGNDKSTRLVAAWRAGLLDEAGFKDLTQRAADES
jgi:hypothetical protein